jgi:diguanylate cyclase (GGDEF)-like protein/PAS domain S-box-containing protein
MMQKNYELPTIQHENEALRQRIAELESALNHSDQQHHDHHNHVPSIQHENEALRQRIAELESALNHSDQQHHDHHNHVPSGDEDVYRNLIEYSLHGMAIFQEQGMVFANRAMERLTGYTIEEMLFWSNEELAEHIYPQDRQGALRHLYTQLYGQDTEPYYEIRITRKDGQQCWVELFAVRTSFRGKPAVQVSYVDATQHKQKEATLKEDQEKFRTFIDFTYNWEYWIGPDGNYIYVSPSCQRITGYSQQEFLDNPGLLHLIIHPDDYAYVANHLRMERIERKKDCDDYGYGFGLAFRIITASGEIRWIGHVFQPVFSADGIWMGNRVSNRDITERIEAEEAMRRSEERYRAISELVSDYVYSLVVERNGAITLEWITDAFTRDTGYTFQEIATHEGRMQIILPEDQPLFRQHHERLLAGQTNVVEVRMITRNGDVRWLQNHGKPVWDETHQRVVRIYAAAQDISERKRTEEAIRESEKRFRLLAENAQDIIYRYRLKPARGYEYISPSVRYITGYTQQEYYDDPDLDLKMLHKESYPFFESMPPASTSTTQESLILPLVHKHGHKIWVEQRHWLVYDEHGTAVAVEGITRDITERKRTEEALRQSEEALQNAHQRLKLWVNELELHNRDTTMLNGMYEFLQQCLDIEEVYQVVVRFATQFFEGISGSLYILDDENYLMESVVTWGEDPPIELVFHPDKCKSLQMRRSYLFSEFSSLDMCEHLISSHPSFYLCIPLITYDQIFGILHMRSNIPVPEQEHERLDWLAVMMGRHVTMTLANLHLREQLYNQSIRDPLTNLFNRRYMNETLERELRKAGRHQQPVGVVMLDVDHFKEFNDTYGHDAGDVVLQKVAVFLQHYIRAEDIACRYGGEEFTLILPGASVENTYKRAEELRYGLETLHVFYEEQPLGNITISAGIACFPDHGNSVASLLGMADHALYEAKRSGRNRVLIASETS